MKSDPVNKAEKIHSDSHWSFTAENYQQALVRFGQIIQPLLLTNNEWHFGLVGNRRLLFTTPHLQAFLTLPVGASGREDLKKIPYAPTGSELASDPISQNILGYTLEKNLVDWPEGTVSIDDPSAYFMILMNNATKKVQTVVKLGLMTEDDAVKVFDAKCKNYR